MVPMQPRILIVENDQGRQRQKQVEQWGIVQESRVRIEGKKLVLCCDRAGNPLDIQPNPRWMPVALLLCDS